jgi:hypothetical protein
MRRSLLLLVPVLALLGGCVHFHSAIEIGPDGAGTCTMSYAMSRSVAEAIAEMEALSPAAEGEQHAPTLSDFDRTEMEKRARDNGVTIRKFEQKTVDGRETLTIEMAFTTVTGLSRVLDQASDGTVLTILREGDNYRLTSIPDPNPPAPAEEPESESPAAAEAAGSPEDSAKMMQVMGKLMQSIEELDIRFEVTVPGDIVESNAPQVEGRTSIWAITAENMMESQGEGMDPEIIFAGGGVKIDAPVKAE